MGLQGCNRRVDVIDVEVESRWISAVEWYVHGFIRVDRESVAGCPFYTFINCVLQANRVFRPNLEIICIEGRRHMY
jgi:hypothetical protein